MILNWNMFVRPIDLLVFCFVFYGYKWTKSSSLPAQAQVCLAAEVLWRLSQWFLHQKSPTLWWSHTTLPSWLTSLVDARKPKLYNLSRYTKCSENSVFQYKHHISYTISSRNEIMRSDDPTSLHRGSIALNHYMECVRVVCCEVWGAEWHPPHNSVYLMILMCWHCKRRSDNRSDK